MATFGFKKSFEDIVEGKPVPEDWYVCVLVREPTVDINSKAKAGGLTLDQVVEDEELLLTVEGAGKNLILDLRIEHDNPEYNGRKLRKWLPLPGPQDADAYTGDGQPLEDAKMQTILETFEAMGGDVGEDTATLEAGARAMFYIVQQPDFRNPDKMSNSISMNHPVRPVE